MTAIPYVERLIYGEIVTLMRELPALLTHTGPLPFRLDGNILALPIYTLWS